MDLEDRPLLHFPDLALALLRAASAGSATIEDSERLLRQDLTHACEAPPKDDGELAAHLDRARRHLAAALLLEMLDPRHFRITPRGRAVLRDHPDGIDDTVLIQFSEFRAWMDRVTAHAPPEDARQREFLVGWNAQAEGADVTDNPFAAETAQHASWEDGWLEAKYHGRE